MLCNLRRLSHTTQKCTDNKNPFACSNWRYEDKAWLGGGGGGGDQNDRGQMAVQRPEFLGRALC